MGAGCTSLLATEASICREGNGGAVAASSAISRCPIPTTAMSSHKKQCFLDSSADFLQAGWPHTPMYHGRRSE